MTRAMRRMRKYLVVVACIALVAGMAIGGTIAWLQDTTQTVTNTFSPSNIELTLTESNVTTDEDSGDQTGAYTVVPGVAMPKDPKVAANSNVAYYVFVKVDAPNWTVDEATHKSYSAIEGKVTCTIDSAWTYYTAIANTNSYVYYKAMDNGGELTATSVLTGNVVNVSSELTDEQLVDATNAMPSLTFTAYAIQQADGGTDNDGKFTVAEAWAQASATSPNP